MPGAIGERTVVLDQAFQRFPGKIETVEVGVAPLQIGHDVQGLGVVVETAERCETLIERALAGVAERRMAEVVTKRRRFRQILVEAERAAERAGDLGDLQGVRQAGAEMIALMEDEHLGLVGEPAERGGVDDSVAVAAEGAAAGALALGKAPASAPRRIRGQRRAGERCNRHG